jgi:hypothetical protein
VPWKEIAWFEQLVSLRVWSVKDVFAAVYTNGATYQTKTKEGSFTAEAKEHRRASLVAKKARDRLCCRKFPNKAQVFSSRTSVVRHRGGVSCIDVPSNVYRPDSVVSGGLTV